MIYKIRPVENPHPIRVSVPGSKSITNRALLIAALANGRSILEGVLFSDDSRHFIDALIRLGFPVDVDEENKKVAITGFGGKVPCDDKTVDVGSAGTAARFLTAYLGLSEGKYHMVSSEQMKKRPMQELLEALSLLGAKIKYDEKEFHFPFTISNPKILGNEVTIDVDKSSQFLSALLISSVLFENGLTINVVGSHGMAYVHMTIKMMETFGVRVDYLSCEDTDYTGRFYIQGGQHYNALDYKIEPDLSAACYFYAMSPLLKVPVVVNGVYKPSLQGDIAFLDVLSDMGCAIYEGDDITVIPPEDGIIKGGRWDLSSFSDQTLTLAAIAPFADSKVEITNVGHIRLQECDRINAIICNLSGMGIEAFEKDGNITILPGNPKAAEIETYDDHRVSMSFSLPGLICDGIVIKDPYCCRKTFENYYEVLEKAVY